MNCKPGDIAMIVNSGRAEGHLVDVLYEAPVGDYVLPDGHWARTESPGRWVCRLIGWQFEAALIHGGSRMASFGTIPDSMLRPIRGEEQPEESTAEDAA